MEKVICYDVFQSPLRGIQRMGRTGRHESGKVVHILSEGQEEDKYHNNAEVSSITSLLGHALAATPQHYAFNQICWPVTLAGFASCGPRMTGKEVHFRPC